MTLVWCDDDVFGRRDVVVEELRRRRGIALEFKLVSEDARAGSVPHATLQDDRILL